jgi:arylsulfatase A-like enzyme
MAMELGPLDATFVPLSDVPKIDSSNSGPGYEGWRFSNWQTNRHFNYVSESERDLLTDEMSAEWFEKKIDWIKQNQNNNQPFFIATGFIRPHTPLVVPKKYYDKFPLNKIKITEKLKDDLIDTKFRENLKETRGHKAWRLLSQGYGSEEKGLKIFTQAYLASINFADEMVGRVLDALDKSSYAKNTIVILFSDHGYLLGQKDHLWKYNLWEETTRVPLIIRQPNNDNNAGKTVTHPVSLIDVFPTISDYCSLKGNTLKSEKGKNPNGFSLKPFVEKPELETWDGPEEALTVVASWKSKLPEKQHLAIRTERYRYIKYFDGSEELYDHQKDSNEWENLAEDKNYKEIVKEMRIRLQKRTDSYID